MIRHAKQILARRENGEQVRLTRREQYHADYIQTELDRRHKNSLGYQIPITTLTSISKLVSEQKCYEIPPADYVPIRLGEATWMQFITTYRSFDIGADFETGIINTGGQNARLATVDTGIDALNIKIFPWAKAIGWSIFDLEYASRSGNWDLVTSLEESRKRNWDLGIQRIAFLGMRGQNGAGGNCLGLLNQAGITANTSLITKPISSMTTAELKSFTRLLVEAYRENCARTAWPTHFVIPESDYVGLASPASPDFPIKSTLQLLEEMFKEIVPYGKFQRILPLAYGDAQYNGLGFQMYAFYNYDEKSLRMDIPLQYTNTLANSIDNFSFQNAGYGQTTGVLAYRPAELMYFKYAP